MDSFRDRFGRRIQYLRVSVTDRCNLRCRYCMPPEGIPLLPRDDILTIEEIARVVGCAVEMGVNTVRISGGEPLVRRGIVELIQMLADMPGLQDLSLTTNGLLLASHARMLKRAGLQRVNVSIDSLDPVRYAQITRGGELSTALAGVQAALDAGLSPVKINVVVLEGTAEEATAFAALTAEQPLHVRFIELMPSSWNINPQAGAHDGIAHGDGICTNDTVRKKLPDLEPAEGPRGLGPARYYRLPGALGTIGFISPMTAPFCRECNRLRLTAVGKLMPCLFSPVEVDIRSALREGAPDTTIKKLLIKAAMQKPSGRYGREMLAKCSMARVGG